MPLFGYNDDNGNPSEPYNLQWGLDRGRAAPAAPVQQGGNSPEVERALAMARHQVQLEKERQARAQAEEIQRRIQVKMMQEKAEQAKARQAQAAKRKQQQKQQQKQKQQSQNNQQTQAPAQQAQPQTQAPAQQAQPQTQAPATQQPQTQSQPPAQQSQPPASQQPSQQSQNPEQPQEAQVDPSGFFGPAGTSPMNSDFSFPNSPAGSNLGKELLPGVDPNSRPFEGVPQGDATDSGWKGVPEGTPVEGNMPVDVDTGPNMDPGIMAPGSAPGAPAPGTQTIPDTVPEMPAFVDPRADFFGPVGTSSMNGYRQTVQDSFLPLVTAFDDFNAWRRDTLNPALERGRKFFDEAPEAFRRAQEENAKKAAEEAQRWREQGLLLTYLEMLGLR